MRLADLQEPPSWFSSRSSSGPRGIHTHRTTSPILADLPKYERAPHRRVLYTKSRRAESFRVPEQLLPYLIHYLKGIRPILLGHSVRDGFWASYDGRRLLGGRLYDIVRARTLSKFGKAMSLHDFRRAAATFLAASSITILRARCRRGGALRHISPMRGTGFGRSHLNLVACGLYLRP
jgi:hypothetical protein